MARFLILMAAFFWSTSGAFSKVIAVDGPVMAFWRALFATVVLLPFVKRDRITFQPLMLAMVACFAIMNVAFVTAMTLTTAANVIFLQYTAPLFIAVASPLFGEKFDRENWLPLAVGLFGVGVLMWGSDPRDIGVWLALLAGLSYAGVCLFLRHFRGQDPVWLTVLNHAGSAVSVGLVLFFLQRPMGLPPDKLALLAAFGAIQMALPYLLFAKGLKKISAQEAGVLTLLEPLLNPVVTFLFVAEVPSGQTVCGGLFLLAGVALRLWRSSRRSGAAA